MTLLSKQEPENRVHVMFCDGSSSEQRFADTAWGNLEAREAFHKFSQNGHQAAAHSVMALYPHVIKIEMWMPAQAADSLSHVCEEFRCPCVEKREKEAIRVG